MSKASFDDFISIAESGQTKTASLMNSADNGILAKLAEELEGTIIPAASSIAGGNPAVLQQIEDAADIGLAMIGGNAEEAAAGEIPAQAIPNQGVVISAGDGEVTDANNFGRTPDAVASAAGDDSSTPAPAQTETEKVAAELGASIADSFYQSLVKQAEMEQYSEAVTMLKEAGLLDGYDFDGMDKTAGQEGEDEFYALDKLANLEDMTYNDMIKAASELNALVELDYLEKEAEDYGRQLAHDYAAEIEQEDAEILEKEAALLQAGYDQAIEDYNLSKEASDVEALMGNEDVVNAVAVLKANGVI